jgi:hypothetical protein
MKVKGVPYSEVKAKALQNPDVMAAYLLLKPLRPDWLSFTDSQKTPEDFLDDRPTVINDEGRFDQ